MSVESKIVQVLVCVAVVCAWQVGWAADMPEPSPCVTRLAVDEEIAERIALNAKRLDDAYFSVTNVFNPPTRRSFGDFQGRVIFALLCHRALTGRESGTLKDVLGQLGSRVNGGGYFGPQYPDVLDEFQLGGHNWYLRAMCEAWRQYHDKRYLEFARRAFEGLFWPTHGQYDDYPTVPRPKADFKGEELRCGKWLLCSDVGASFMASDGLSDYFATSGDVRAKELVDEMLERFDALDKLKLKNHTHSTLSTVRGALRMYEVTHDEKYMRIARRGWDLYVSRALAADYENFNWFCRGDTWTESCTVADSLIVALHMYKLRGSQADLSLARRIWHNGFAAVQHAHGGAGSNYIVTPGRPVRRPRCGEVPYCCTLRLSEALRWAKDFAGVLAVDIPGAPRRDALGRYFAGDLQFGELVHEADYGLVEQKRAVTVDGHRLIPLVKFYRLQGRDDELWTGKFDQRVIFP